MSGLAASDALHDTQYWLQLKNQRLFCGKYTLVSGNLTRCDYLFTVKLARLQWAGQVKRRLNQIHFPHYSISKKRKTKPVITHRKSHCHVPATQLGRANAGIRLFDPPPERTRQRLQDNLHHGCSKETEPIQPANQTYHAGLSTFHFPLARPCFFHSSPSPATEQEAQHGS